MRKLEVPKNLMIDSGFWYALYDSRDQYHEKAIDFIEYLEFHNLLIPWPSLYETLNTRFVRNPEWLRAFERYLHRPDTVRLPDEAYREEALHSVLRIVRGWRSISLVDMVIRSIIEDPNIKIDAMITFNQDDFIDICSTRNIEIISD